MFRTTRCLISTALLINSAALLRAQSTEPPALRTLTLQFIQPLPEKMPGTEADTPERIQLGRALFFEKRLSKNGTQSCNSCHAVDQNRAGADNEPTSPGAFGARGGRNSPTVLNAGYHIAQFWDGRAATLEDQAKGPILNPGEMAMPDEKEVLARLTGDAHYPESFASAFPGEANPVTYDNLAKAIASFERTLRTRDRFDDFLKGDDKALSGNERSGLQLFVSTGCVTCHMGPAIGGNLFQKMGLVKPYANDRDAGRSAVTKNDAEKFFFKVPSLRNIALTYPYFHDGGGKSLEDAITTMADIQLGKKLSSEDTGKLVAFLHTLSDKERGAASAGPGKSAAPLPAPEQPPVR